MKGTIGTLMITAVLLAGCAGSDDGDAAGPVPCPDAVDEVVFASEAKLRELTAEMASFGLRSTASDSNEAFIDWLDEQLRQIEGVTTRTQEIALRRWQPLPMADDQPGRDLARAGDLRLIQPGGSTVEIPVAGAVPYALPTSESGSLGPLVYLASDQAITPANAAGKVVLRDFPDRVIPYVGFELLGIYITPDLAGRPGLYERPYLAALHEEMLAAGSAGAAGIIFAFDVPTEQVRGYWDPHNGTHYTVPGVFVGGDEAEELKAQATGNVSASVVVRAETDDATTRNLIATLPGQSPERIVFAVNTDGNTWVQDNGNAGLLALARYLGDLPMSCRPRTFELVFGGAHLHISREGTTQYAAHLDREYDDGTVAFAFVLEHLGAREILPVPDADGSGQHLEFSGGGDPFLWAAGDSEALRQAAVTATQQRNLDYTAVLRGAELPVEGRAPEICSFGGIGGAFQGYLIPTMAMISGPWSLWAPSFGESAIDFTRMRRQLLAAGDTVLALAELPSEQIAGDYPRLRAQRAAGAPTCSHDLPPEQAPLPAPTATLPPLAATATATQPAATATPTLPIATATAVQPTATPTSTPAGSPVEQPQQPASGPGGSDYVHGDWRVTSGGSDNDAWYVFEPIDPQPASAPLAIVMHGYGEYAGYDQMYELIRHTVRKGSIVIYPRWQTTLVVPCPGPFNIEPCMSSALNGIRGGLAYLEGDPSRVQPELDETSYFGFSFGGIITANLANRHESLQLPQPRAVFLEDPHDGGLVGPGEPALDDSLAGIPSTVKLQCHSSADGVISAVEKAQSSCNAIFPLLGHIPDENKDLVLTYTDTHGDPDLSSAHGVCAAPPGRANAYDWNFCWKVWDALRSAAHDGTDSEYALGDTVEHRSNGTWSDGVPIIPLKIQDTAPIAR